MIYFIISYAWEAKPIVKQWKMQLVYQKFGYALYKGDETFLLITGSSDCQVASGMGWVKGLTPIVSDSIWIHIGHCYGSDYHGTVVAPCKINGLQGDSFYPSIAFDLTMPYLDFRSTYQNKIKTTVKQEVWDKESSIFFQTALKFTQLEWIHIWKISVTYSPSSNTHSILKDEAWIESNIHLLEVNLSKLLKVRQTLIRVSNERWVNDCNEYFKCSFSEQCQLEELSRKSKALNMNFNTLTIQKFSCVKDLMNHIKRRLETYKLSV